ncbi:MAG: pyridoxal 5'-phosphate synthase glutaminase subunit PdxT [Acidobacteriota bacterium]
MAGKGLIGVLALRGAFEAPREVFGRLGVTTVLVRTAEELQEVDALVFPGGESSAMLRLMEPQELFILIGTRIHSGLPVLATCAGVILLAAEVTPHQKSLGALDIDVERNAYGRQVFSSVESLRFGPQFEGNASHEGVFIRAPRITRVGDGVEALAWRGDDPVLVRSPGVLAATFHPELGSGTLIHELFLQEIERQRR